MDGPFADAAAYLLVVSYLDASAVSAGISPDISFYLVGIVSAGSALGRIIGGYISDGFGLSICVSQAELMLIGFLSLCRSAEFYSPNDLSWCFCMFCLALYQVGGRVYCDCVCAWVGDITT